MLHKNWSPFYIAKSLQMSRTSVFRIAKQLEQGVYNQIINIANKIKRKRKFEETLEKILRAGLPPRGRGRWRSLYSK